METGGVLVEKAPRGSSALRSSSKSFNRVAEFKVDANDESRGPVSSPAALWDTDTNPYDDLVAQPTLDTRPGRDPSRGPCNLPQQDSVDYDAPHEDGGETKPSIINLACGTSRTSAHAHTGPGLMQPNPMPPDSPNHQTETVPFDFMYATQRRESATKQVDGEYPSSARRPPAGQAKNRRRSLLNFFMRTPDEQGQGHSLHEPPSPLRDHHDQSTHQSSPLQPGGRTSARFSRGSFESSGRLTVDTLGSPTPQPGSRKSFLRLFSKSEATGSGANAQDLLSRANSGTSCGSAASDDDKPRISRKSRRSSFIDFFRSGTATGLHNEADSGVLNPPDWNQSGIDRASRGSQKSKSQRGSFIDFFKPMPNGADGAEGERVSRRLSAKMSSRSRGRRASMADIFNEGLGMFKRMGTTRTEFSDDDDDDDATPRWFTSIDDFRPLTYCYSRGLYKSSYFASALKTGEHHVLKVYDKALMHMSIQRGLRRAFAFATSLSHENIVRVKGTWETAEAMYIVEEYAIKGDLQSDFNSHPERYTEIFVASTIVKPLLTALVYLHEQAIIHRCVTPERILLGRDNKLTLCNFLDAVDTNFESPEERVKYLDYMAPEMFAVKDTFEQVLVRKAGDSVSQLGAGGSRGPRVGRKAPRARSNSQQELKTEASVLSVEASGLSLGPESSSQDVLVIVPVNAWEWQDSYDDKVDIWQVGVLIHELLCESLPFETDNKILAAALIMWADVARWPDTISPQAVEFMQKCLTKDPKERPTAKQLLNDPWITLHAAGEALLSTAALAAKANEPQTLMRETSSSLLASSGGVLNWFRSFNSRRIPTGGEGGVGDKSKESMQQGAGASLQSRESLHGGTSLQGGIDPRSPATMVDYGNNEEEEDNPFAKQRAQVKQRQMARNAAVPPADVDQLRQVW